MMKDKGRPTYEVFASAIQEERPEAKYDKFVSAGKTLDGEGKIEEGAGDSGKHVNDGRALFEVLQETKSKKQEDWEKTHNPFQPPKALDEDETKFLEEWQQSSRTEEEEKQKELKEQLESFREARKSHVYSKVEELPVPEDEPATTDAAPASAEGKGFKPFQNRLSIVKVIKKESNPSKSQKEETKPAAKPAANVLQGLVMYASDEDEDEHDSASE